MELATPITIHWDLPAASVDTDYLLRICSDVVACRPLVLHLRHPGTEAAKGMVPVLDYFRDELIAVSLTIPPSAVDEVIQASFEQLLQREMLLAVENIETLEGKAAQYLLPFRGEDREGMSFNRAGISFAVTAENWRQVPPLFSICRDLGISRLVLPMQRLQVGDVPFSLSPHEQDEVAKAVGSGGGVQGMDITIHDPFLWRAVNPGVPFPQGGCQAGNTMIAIAPGGEVFPCPSFPAQLGRVGEATLKEIISSPKKKELRRALLEMPSACGDCKDSSECRGGCRGRSFVLHHSLQGADCACGRLDPFPAPAASLPTF